MISFLGSLPPDHFRWSIHFSLCRSALQLSLEESWGMHCSCLGQSCLKAGACILYGRKAQSSLERLRHAFVRAGNVRSSFDQGWSLACSLWKWRTRQPGTSLAHALFAVSVCSFSLNEGGGCTFRGGDAGASLEQGWSTCFSLRQCMLQLGPWLDHAFACLLFV